MSKTLITAGCVLTMDETLSVREPGFVVVDGDRIVEVGSGTAPGGTFDDVLELNNHVLMPGLVNAHTHTPMVLTRGMCEGVSLFTLDGFIHTLRRYESFEDEQMVAPAVAVSCAEMIRTGTTCFADQYFYAEEIFREVDSAGLRATIAYGIVELGDEVARSRELASAERFLEMATGHERITGWVGPHAFFVDNSLPLIEAEIALAKKYDAGFHIHFATSNEEDDYCQANYGISAAAKMEELGILDVPLLAAHCVSLTNDDIERFARFNFNPVISPSSSMRSGFPAAPVTDMRAAGLNVSLGTDNVCSSNSYDMLSELGTFGKLMIHSNSNTSVMTPAEIVAMATRNGAKALGLSEEIGSLEPGKRADLIALDMGDIGWAPRAGQDYYTQLVYSVAGHSVTHSMVNGAWLMRDRQLQTIDYNDAVDRFEATNRELQSRMR